MVYAGAWNYQTLTNLNLKSVATYWLYPVLTNPAKTASSTIR